MSPRDVLQSVEAALRCDHCGRAVRETQHTRTTYSVDYYSLHSGNGEVCSFTGDDGMRGVTYVKLLDRFDVTTCAECYRQASVQAELDRRFQPERAHAALQQRDR